MKRIKGETGFTLIELVLVIIVLGILSAVAIVQFGNMASSARDGAIDGAFGAASSQLAIGVGLCRGYPIVEALATVNVCDSSTNDFSGNFETVVFTPFSSGLTGDLAAAMKSAAVGPPGVNTFNICSGSAGNGRFALATFTRPVAGTPTMTLGAKADWPTANATCGAN